MKRTVYKTSLIACLVLASAAFWGCAAASADEVWTEQEERFVETSEDMGQEDTDMAEADINKAEKAVA